MTPLAVDQGILSAAEILASPVDITSDSRQVCCPLCYHYNKVILCTTRGDPRNIAYIGKHAVENDVSSIGIIMHICCRPLGWVAAFQ